jgi:hypothetical protein
MLYLFLIIILLSTITNIFLLICLKKAFNQIDTLESWLVEFKYLINQTYNKLKFVDDRGIFVKDDDVGFIFNEMLQIIDITNKRIQTNDNDKFSNINEKNQS